jgi:hypothetical protein
MARIGLSRGARNRGLAHQDRFEGRRQALTTSTVIGNCTSLCSFTGT